MIEVKKGNKEEKLETGSTYTVEYIDYCDGTVTEKTTSIKTRTFTKDHFIEEINREKEKITRMLPKTDHLDDRKNALDSIVIEKKNE